ncbi:MAG: M20/M25/M40 family metallo-hydrolase [Actinomycetota bacterium]|nr:M20/M25/M40 family metallo-hydrolase [Actinomycetota bacterium]
MTADLTAEATELLQTLIRNQCVNDGAPESGFEVRSAELLRDYLEGGGLDVETYESRPGRGSLVARIEGSDPEAPTLCLMGHTDVVPVSPDGWSRDPFGGELVDGEVWGRGAIDMLNLTATQAVMFKELARSGFKPRGTLLYFAVADEEAGGTYGAKWMAEHHWDAIACDYLLTEMGGIPMPHSDGRRRVTLTVGEKGIAWRRLRIGGTPGHGSMPYGADSALLKAAEVVRRLGEYRPKARIDEVWERTVRAYELPDDLTERLLDPARVWDAFADVGDPARAKMFHACTHTTFSPNVIHGGVKTNVIPDTVDIDVDIRTVPGTTGDDVDANLREALGELADDVAITRIFDDEATTSPAGNPLWDSIERRARDVYPEAELLPQLIVGATDSRYFRNKGVVAYGTGLYSPEVTFEQWASRFHGHDERIDVASLGLTLDLWRGVIDDLIA